MRAFFGFGLLDFVVVVSYMCGVVIFLGVIAGKFCFLLEFC